MQWQITIESILLVFSSVIVSVVAYGLWWKRNAPGAKYLLVMMLSSSIWCLFSAIEYAAVSPEVRVWASKFQYIGIFTLVPTYVMFGLRLSQIERWMTIGVRTIIRVVPIITIFLAFTNEYHGLVWADITLIPGSYGLVYHHGLWFWFATIYSYICLLIGSVLIVYAVRNRLAASRTQTSVILIAVVVPWAANILYLIRAFPISGIDPTPFAFALSGILFAVSIYRFQIFNITPIARDKLIDTMDDLLIVIDSQCQIVDLNPSAAKTLQVKRESVIGQPACEMLSYWPHLASLFMGGFQGKTVVRTIQDQAGLWFSLRISPLQDRREKLTGWMILLRDINEGKEQDAEVQRLASIIEEASDSIVLTDTDGNIIYANPVFEKLTGYTIAEVLGENPRILKSGIQNNTFYKKLWNVILSGETWRGTFINKRKDGSLYHEAATIFPITDVDGQITNYAAVKNDITEQVLAQQALEKSERQYRLLADNVTDVIWTMDLDGHFTYVSPSVEQLRGYTSEEAEKQSIEDVLTPESLEADLPRFQSITEIIQAGETLTEPSIFEFEQPCKDGSTVWVETIVNIMYDDDGEAMGILGLTRDITERKKAQEEISAYARFQNLLNQITHAANSQSNFQEMLQTLADRMGELFNADGCYITLWNEQEQQVIPGAAYGPIREKYRSNLKIPKPGEPSFTKQVLTTGVPLVIPDVLNSPYLNPQVAAQFPAKSQLVLPLIANDQKLGAALIAYNRRHEFSEEDVRLGNQAAAQLALAIQKARLLEEAEYLAIHDSLTGLLNRRHFMNMARQEYARSQRYQYPLSIMMFDIDHFKRINDTYGHPIGDQVLETIAQNCLSSIRTSDIVGRYGGEEFIVLLPETPVLNTQDTIVDTSALSLDELPAKSVAARLRKTIEETSITLENGEKVGVTISLGIAEKDDSCTDIERLIDRADQALLEAKQKGRNQIVIWNLEP